MEFYVLWLISLEIKNSIKIRLLKYYENEKNVFDNFDEIRRSYKDVRDIDNNKIKDLKKILLEKGISYTTYGDDKYPELLLDIKNPPYVLFYKGDISLVKGECVAIIGGRQHSLYAERATRFIARESSFQGFTIVSGGARGIDSIAHKEALINKGKTIVVLGSGIDVIYPKENKRLFEKVIEEGLLISEFMPGTEPYSKNFPRRNRIISGLSQKLILTEASKKSGSLITVNFAINQNREVGIVPSQIFSEYGEGSNLVLADGASPIVSRETLQAFLGLKKVKIKSMNSLIQNEILNIIRDEPVHIDQIFEKSQVDRNTLYRLLFEMQIKNEVVSLPGNYYARII
ncbi:MAG: DNA-processing protein DprA [Clostridium sp.]|uniref:DNA-processing protein DprA n=1 Tax=Clostridium sp. TaxID=1506 RepID=UPI003F3BA6FF